jgi:AcrR family transcriptional regulator
MVEETAARGERTRLEILQAAHQLFLKHGYHGTSVRQIASETGIALGTIYNHFSSKEDIFIAVLIEYHPLFAVLPSMIEARGESFEAFIHEAARCMVNGIDNRLDFLNLVFIELVEFKGQHLPIILKKMYPLLLDFYQRFGEQVQELRPIPMPVAVRAFIGLFFSYLMTELIISNQMPAEFQEGAFDYFIEIYLHGVQVENYSTGNQLP